MEPNELRGWIEAHGYTVSALARELDVDRKTVQRYLNGTTSIPKTFALSLEVLAGKK